MHHFDPLSDTAQQSTQSSVLYLLTLNRQNLARVKLCFFHPNGSSLGHSKKWLSQLSSSVSNPALGYVSPPLVSPPFLDWAPSFFWKAGTFFSPSHHLPIHRNLPSHLPWPPAKLPLGVSLDDSYLMDFSTCLHKLFVECAWLLHFESINSSHWTDLWNWIDVSD